MSQSKLVDAKHLRKTKEKTFRYPNLSTIIMVETFLEEQRAQPMQLVAIKKGLPTQVMHQTLKVILNYLWKSGKIIYGPKGVQWIYVEPKHLRSMMDDTLEV